MFVIKIPNVCTREQSYILDVLLNDFLGLTFALEVYDGKLIKITKTSGEGELTLNTDFFQKAHQYWLKPESMPVLPLVEWKPLDDGIEADLVKPSVPVLYGQPGLLKKEKQFHLSFDLFGSAFFMLSRYEELITKDRDYHNRFPAWASVAYKANILDRPIVNEYLEILWSIINLIWPDLSRKKRKFRKLISCDVDHPFDLAGYSFKKTILRVGARVFRDKNPRLALHNALNYVFKKLGSNRFDGYRNSINWIMEVNKAAGNKVAFYFIPIQTDANKESPNDIRTQKISCLLKHIVESGHEIGFHPGYNTYKFSENFQDSARALKEACLNQELDVSNLGGRQHYLRYDVAETPMLWQDSGFTYDSSLGYADKAGFRCGICYEYTMYNLTNREKMTLKQRPLIVMECTIINKSYEALGFTNKAVQRFEYFINICQKFNGDYAMLWHNSEFHHKRSRLLYSKLIRV